MHRIDSVNSVGNRFKDTPTPGTRVTAAWANEVQEEIVSVILAAGIALVKGQEDQLLKAIRKLGGSRPGRIEMWGGATAPAGTLECDGSEVLKETYPALWAAIGETWGTAANPAYFVLPDLRGRTFRGWDHGAGRDPGRALGSYQDDAVGPLDLQMPWATSPSSSNDLNSGGGIMTDLVSSAMITWAPEATNTEAETRVKSGAGMFIIQAV